MAVTEEVSLTAVPAKRAKPSLDRWKPGAEGWKDERSQDIEEKDNGDGLATSFP